MIISIIAAIDKRGAIGQNNEIPWSLSADMQRFKKLTDGHTVIMGRRTYGSLPGNHDLPGRKMIVLSSNDKFRKSLPPHITASNSILNAINDVKSSGETELFIIGGWEVYMLGLLFADRLYLTKVHTTTLGKVIKFPEIAWDEWQERMMIGPYPADDNNQYPYSFSIYDRIKCDRPSPKKEGFFEFVTCHFCGREFKRGRAELARCRAKKRNIFCSSSCSRQNQIKAKLEAAN